METWLLPEWKKICESVSPRVAEQGWISLQKLLSQKDKLANLANCLQASLGTGGQLKGGVGLLPVGRGVGRVGCGCDPQR